MRDKRESFTEEIKMITQSTRFTLLASFLSLLFDTTGVQALDHEEIFEAVEKGDIIKFEKLAKNTSAWATQYPACPPLVHAVGSSGSIAMMKILLKNGININNEFEWYGTVLRYVSTGRRSDKREAMAAFLIEHGAKLDFISAVALNRCELVSLFLHSARLFGMDKSWLDVQGNWGTAGILHYAATQGNDDMIRLILDFRGDVNRKSFQGSPPIHWAISGGHLETVKLLVARGAQVDLTDWGGNSPLHYALLRKENLIAEFLLKQKANANSVVDGRDYLWNGSGLPSTLDTPLHVVADYGDSKMIEMLIAYGAKVNAKNRAGDTPLAIAQEKLNKDAVETLIRLGGKP